MGACVHACVHVCVQCSAVLTTSTNVIHTPDSISLKHVLDGCVIRYLMLIGEILVTVQFIFSLPQDCCSGTVMTVHTVTTLRSPMTRNSGLGSWTRARRQAGRWTVSLSQLDPLILIGCSVVCWRKLLINTTTTVCMYVTMPCRSWQVVQFDPLPATFIKIVGTHNTANEVSPPDSS